MEIEIAAIIISIVALLVSTVVAIKGWSKNRNIYGIEIHSFRDKQKREKLLKKLNSGKYTVLNSHGDYPDFEILIGRTKK